MRVSTCCCGCSLETGCKIIAILGLMAAGGSTGLVTACVTDGYEGLIASNILSIVAAGLLLWGAV